MTSYKPGDEFKETKVINLFARECIQRKGLLFQITLFLSFLNQNIGSLRYFLVGSMRWELSQ